MGELTIPSTQKKPFHKLAITSLGLTIGGVVLIILTAIFMITYTAPMNQPLIRVLALLMGYLPFCLSVFSIVTGIISFNQITKQGSRGLWMAIVGIVFGAMGILISGWFSFALTIAATFGFQ